MTIEQVLVLAIISATLGILIADRWRYDLVAVCGLMACVLVGVIAPEKAFMGLADPAVITVAAVLVLSASVARTGAVSRLATLIGGRADQPMTLLLALCPLAVVLSAFMNNVGALALLMPVAASLCSRHRIPLSRVLMPLSFATLLGGMTTLIGTPPNLLVSGFREQAGGTAFGMFDFALVGAPVAVIGVLWLVLVGWRPLPGHESTQPRPAAEPGYTAELVVPADSRLVGAGRETLAAEGIRLLGLVRQGQHVFDHPARLRLQPGDLAALEVDRDTLIQVVNAGALTLPHAPRAAGDALIDAVVTPNSLVLGSSARTLELASRWDLELVAINRQGRRFEGRLGDATLAIGDVLLVAGETGRVNHTLAELGCLPLQDSGTPMEPVRALPPFLVFGAAVAAAASGLLAPSVAFVLAATLSFVLGWIRPEDLRRRIDWSVIVLLAAMIPLGGALEATGTAALLAGGVLALAGDAGPVVLLALTLAVTMLLTPFLNNPATVVVLAPIVISLAQGANLSPDPFLIAVALGASCDFLTPFGHHNNALIMGPGRYRVLDYPRAGWPLSLIVFASATALISLVWDLV